MARRFGESESQWLKASDLLVPGKLDEYKSPKVTIERVAEEQIGFENDKKSKFVLYFRGAQKGMVLNATTEATLIDLFGQPTDNDLTRHFGGRTVMIYVDKNVKFQGRRVPGLRLRGFGAGAPMPPAPEPDEEPPIPDEEPVDDDDVPF